MLTSRRTVFFISDSTAITAEALGQSLLTQFDHVLFEQVTLPFIDTQAKAERVVNQINMAARQSGLPPLVFSTLINHDIRATVMKSQGSFSTFSRPSSTGWGIEHGIIPYHRPLPQLHQQQHL